RPSRAPEGQWLHDKAPVSASSAPTDKILVSNLHYEITAKDLTAIFGQIGTLVREPLIRYDRSGRSSGQATVSFETVAEAVRAKKQFNGILAKGQPMTVDFLATRQPRGRSSSAPNGSLINRIQKPPLLDRLASRDDSNVRSASATPVTGGVGPIRSRQGPRAPRAAKKGPKKPPTAEELDKELDAFMGDSNSPAAPDGDAATAGTALVESTEVAAPVQDVEMA
ncbi:RNA-binding domain-containing protein, partial [Macrolepiota fuliginosa MF-IS2]